MVELEEIPGPPGLPFLGNVQDLDPVNSIASLERLAEIYGEIEVFSLLFEACFADHMFPSSRSYL